MATQNTYIKEVTDGFASKATLMANGDILELVLGNHAKWSIKATDAANWGWTVGQSYNIIGRLPVTVVEGTGTGATVLSTQTVVISQPTPTIVVPDIINVTVTVTTRTVVLSQPTPTIFTTSFPPGGGVTVLVDVQTVVLSQPAETVSVGTGITKLVDAQTVVLSQPTVAVATGVGASAATQTVVLSQPTESVATGVGVSATTLTVVLSQPVHVIQIPVGDTVMWFYDGSEWVSFQTLPLVASFSNTSPYTGDEFAIFGSVTSDASNIGMRMRRSTHWVTMSIQSDVSIGTPPSSSCSVQLFVDGASQTTIPFDGVTYGASSVIDVDAGVGALVTFKYVDDAGGQSAGKVVVMAEYRWRRA